MTRSIFTEQYDRLCAILIDARIAAGLSQAELAKGLGRPQSFVSKYETKQRRLDVVEFLQVAHCLRQSGPELLGRLADGSSNHRVVAGTDGTLDGHLDGVAKRDGKPRRTVKAKRNA